MLLMRKVLALAAILIAFSTSTPISSGTSTPHIRIDNKSKDRICYKVEYSNGTGIFPKDAVCGGAEGPQVAGFWLSSGEQKVVQATNSSGIGFNGAITTVLNKQSLLGARYEINFSNITNPFWDVDWQYGITDGTCGPLNSNHLTGERDTLGKANAAWRTLDQTKKNHLRQFPEYLKQGANGSLTHINMTVGAWPERADVIQFFQETAGFKGYVGPGSVNGAIYGKDSTLQKLVDLADLQTTSDVTNTIAITSY